MAANKDLSLIAKIVDTGDIRTAYDAGIRVENFIETDARLMWDYVYGYWRNKATSGDVPTREMLHEAFPSVDMPPETRISIKSTVDEFLKHDTTARLRKLGSYIDDWAERPDEAIAHLDREIREMRKIRRSSTDITVSASGETVKRLYEANKQKNVLSGIPYPWKILNDETRGMQDGEYIIIYGRPKCVVAGQRVMGPTGKLISIETPPEKVPTTSGHSLTWGDCTGTYAGKKKAVRITTKSGHVLEVGEDHPLLVPDMTYRAASDLTVGAFVGVARKLPGTTPGDEALTTTEAEILGYLVGDGNYTQNAVHFTNEDEDVIKRVSELANALGAMIHHNSSRYIEYGIVTKRGQPNPVLNLLGKTGCHGQKGPNKHVPAALFESSEEAIAAFLSGYTDTDGSVGKRTVCWCSASYNLIRDVKHLLLRFGITGTISEVLTNFGTTAWHLNVFSQEQHVLLNRILHLSCGHKARDLKKLAKAKIRRKRHDDGIPYSDKLMSEIIKAKGNKEWKYLWSGFSVGKLFRRTGRISRHLLRKLAAYLDAPALLEWANSDIRWEPIISIEKLGKKKCYDITMEAGEPVFVVEDFVTHNSLKTYLALYVATYAYDFASCNILIYTREMSPEQMLVRSVCFLIGAPYTAWKRGILHEIPHPHGGNMDDHFHATMDTMYADEKTCSLETGRNKKLIITSDREDRKYGGAVGGLQRKMEDFHPDLTVVDAVYLMKNDRDGVGTRSVKWGDQSAISQDLKDLAQDTKRVILATLQANRASEKPDQRGQSTTNLAYSDSYAQDTDLAIEIIKRKVNNEHNELALAITASRETNIAGFAIHGDPCNDFTMLEREVCDDMGVMKNPDGTKVIQSVVFQDPRDIKQFFWKNHIPHVLPNYDAPEESSGNGGHKMKGPPSLHIPGR